jgi:excisionase family DNA binding protein
MERFLYSPEEVAESLGIGRTRVYEFMASGRLFSVKVGRSRRVPVKALREFVDELAAEPQP